MVSAEPEKLAVASGKSDGRKNIARLDGYRAMRSADERMASAVFQSTVTPFAARAIAGARTSRRFSRPKRSSAARVHAGIPGTAGESQPVLFRSSTTAGQPYIPDTDPELANGNRSRRIFRGRTLVPS